MDVAELRSMRPAPPIVVGGPGWKFALISPAIHLTFHLPETVATLAVAVTAT